MPTLSVGSCLVVGCRRSCQGATILICCDLASCGSAEKVMRERDNVTWRSLLQGVKASMDVGFCVQRENRKKPMELVAGEVCATACQLTEGTCK